MANNGVSWKCSVCGYLSETETAPEKCPVCGVPHDKFEAFVSQKAASEAPDYWQCMVCRHKHYGDSPPVNCPVCGVSSEKFESIAEIIDSTDPDSNNRIVIAGGGIAGLTAAEQARITSPASEITLISKEKKLPYYRLNLTRYIAGEVTYDVLPVHPEAWYEDNNIKILTDSEVVDVDAKESNVKLNNGETINYDRLILTAGSHPFIPPVQGAELKGVTTLRFFDDANYILSKTVKPCSVVIVGGGVLGLETAGALKSRNKELKITIIEGFDYLMPRQLNKKAADYLLTHLDTLGINVITGTSVQQIRGSEQVEEIVTGNGDVIPADLVVFSVGVRPNRYLAGYCGLKVNNGVIVNDNMETSVPGIYAAGDITEHRGVLYGLWNAAMFQGKIAGMNAAGKKTGFGGIPRSNTLKVLDVNIFSIGNFTPCDGSCIIIEDEDTDRYAYILFRDGKIEGAIFYGDTSESALVKTAIEEKTSLPASVIKKNNFKDVINFLSASN